MKRQRDGEAGKARRRSTLFATATQGERRRHWIWGDVTRRRRQVWPRDASATEVGVAREAARGNWICHVMGQRFMTPIRVVHEGPTHSGDFFFGAAATAQKKGPARRFSEQPQHSQFVGPVTPRRGQRDRCGRQEPFKYFSVRQPGQDTLSMRMERGHCGRRRALSGRTSQNRTDHGLG